MSHKLPASLYTGIEELENTLSGDSMAYAFRTPLKVVTVKAKPIHRKGTDVMTKDKRIENTYSQIIAVMVLFAILALFNVVTEKMMNRNAALLLLILSAAGVLAFHNDKERWRKRSET